MAGVKKQTAKTPDVVLVSLGIRMFDQIAIEIHHTQSRAGLDLCPIGFDLKRVGIPRRGEKCMVSQQICQALP